MDETGADRAYRPVKRASFLNLPVEIQLHVLRLTRDPNSRNATLCKESMGFVKYGFPPALLVVSRHFHRLGKRVFYKENEFGIAVFDPEFVLTSDRAWPFPSLLSHIETLHLRLEFPRSGRSPHGQTWERGPQGWYQSMHFVLEVAAAEIRRLTALRRVRISVRNSWKSLSAVLTWPADLSCLKTLPKDVSYELAATESSSDIVDEHEMRAQILLSLRRLLRADVSDVEPPSGEVKWASLTFGYTGESIIG